MHTHQSLWKGGKPLFAGDGYAGLFAQLLVIILPRLLQFRLFQHLLKLRFDVVKGFLYLVFLYHVNSLEFCLAGLRNLLIYFFLKDLLGRDALLLCLGLQQLLID